MNINYDVSEFQEPIVPNNVQNRHSHQDTPYHCEQTYTLYKNLQCTLRVSKAVYWKYFSHAHDICDRVWFKDDLKMVINDNIFYGNEAIIFSS